MLKVPPFIDCKEFKLTHFKLVHKTEILTKWKLEVHLPGKRKGIQVYLTRPAHETEKQLMAFIQSCQRLSDLIMKPKPGPLSI